jgi:hypothetical protein
MVSGHECQPFPDRCLDGSIEPEDSCDCFPGSACRTVVVEGQPAVYVKSIIPI